MFASRYIMTAALRANLRDQTVLLIAGLFIVLVLISAYLGWSATATVQDVYLKVVEAYAAKGQIAPPNPVPDTPPLGLLRNMATYVALIGALAGLVLGNKTVSGDRKSGVYALLASRPITSSGIALGKILAIIIAITGLLGVAALTNVITFMILPNFSLSADEWFRLAQFYIASDLYVISFGLLGAFFAITSRSEAKSLMIPVTIWLTVTFIIPQLTANVLPMAALNPLKAMAPAPSGAFFVFTQSVLTPISFAEAYRALAATLLDFAPPGFKFQSFISPMLTLMIVNGLLISAVVVAFGKMDASRSAYDD
ncbi:MAG: ABC transporter permease [Magnetovibrio sp.]|nr:ABC transporter permease [Magnetovibrio sp.]